MRNKRFIFIMGFVLLGILGKAQSVINSSLNTDSIKAWQLYQQAILNFENSNYSITNAFADTSLQKAFYSSDDVLKGYVYFLKAKIENDDFESLKNYLLAANAFENANRDTSLIQVFEATAKKYYSLEAYEKSLEYYIKAYNHQLTYDDSKKQMYLLENCALAAYAAGDTVNTNKFFQQLISLAGQESDEEYLLRSYYNLATLKVSANENVSAIEMYTKMLAIYEQNNDYQGISLCHNNIAYNYNLLPDYEKAQHHFHEAIKFSEEGNISKAQIASMQANLGIAYQNTNQIDKAIQHLEEANNIFNELDKTNEVARIDYILATLYFYQLDYYNSEQYCHDCIEHAKESNEIEILKDCYLSYSQVLKAGNDYIKALDYYELHLALRDSLRTFNFLKEQMLSGRIYKLEKAEKELKLEVAEKEKTELLFNQLKLEKEKTEKEVELLRRQGEIEQLEKAKILQALALERERMEQRKKENRIMSLLWEQQRDSIDKAMQKETIKKLEIEKKNQELENAKNEAELAKQEAVKQKIVTVIGLVILIAIIIALGLINAIRKNKLLGQQKIEIEEKNSDLEQKNEEILSQRDSLENANKEIQLKNKTLESQNEEILSQNEEILSQNDQIVKQNEMIEEKNKAITDSIQYAKRIQTAVLPPIDKLKGVFDESFVLFRPRDIVSGDFYWIDKRESRVYIAAADCTGHGVPGAFMSMLGLAFLNDILNKEESISSGQMLNALRNKIIKALRQKGTEGEQKDGMDIALCVVDLDKEIIEFSGANNPMYQIRNKELIKINSDRMPIGIHSKANQPFSQTTISYQKGDCFYLFSDGYADQFGGDEGKKLKYKPFQQKLIGYSNYEMLKQHDLLLTDFEKWKGNHEQIDDVLVMGFRL